MKIWLLITDATFQCTFVWLGRSRLAHDTCFSFATCSYDCMIWDPFRKDKCVPINAACVVSAARFVYLILCFSVQTPRGQTGRVAGRKASQVRETLVSFSPEGDIGTDRGIWTGYIRSWISSTCSGSTSITSYMFRFVQFNLWIMSNQKKFPKHRIKIPSLLLCHPQFATFKKPYNISIKSAMELVLKSVFLDLGLTPWLSP
jgi:hypothetical protein